MGHLRRPHLQVVYGEPFRLPKEGKLTSEELQAATDLIMQRIAVLLPAEYRGVYARRWHRPSRSFGVGSIHMDQPLACTAGD
jgi:hypothetical protein